MKREPVPIASHSTLPTSTFGTGTRTRPATSTLDNHISTLLRFPSCNYSPIPRSPGVQSPIIRITLDK